MGSEMCIRDRSFKSTDAPWFNAEARRAVRRKVRIYKEEGKSDRFKQAQRDCSEIIKEAKKKFWDKILQKTARI